MNSTVHSDHELSNDSSDDSPAWLVWVEWGNHLRTNTLSARLGAELVAINISGNRPLRYLRSAVRTIRAIHAMRPPVLIATNPSLVLGFFLLMLRPLYRFRLVSDAHFVGVHPLHPNPLLQRILDFHNRRMSRVIVTNEVHARRIESLGVVARVCPDPLPEILVSQPSDHAFPDKSCFLICSFDSDEPYGAAIEAFRTLEAEGYTLYISGNYAKVSIDPGAFPWVRFLGFVPDHEYYATLAGCSVAMDLTEMDNCLVCGAYEALSLARPLIVSNTSALRAYFGGACILTDNTVDGIAASVRQAYAQRDELAALAADWAESNELGMGRTLEALRNDLLTLCSS